MTLVCAADQKPLSYGEVFSPILVPNIILPLRPYLRGIAQMLNACGWHDMLCAST